MRIVNLIKKGGYISFQMSDGQVVCLPELSETDVRRVMISLREAQTYKLEFDYILGSTTYLYFFNTPTGNIRLKLCDEKAETQSFRGFLTNTYNHLFEESSP